MKARETVEGFVDRINARDPDGLGELMSDDHIFIDALGNKVQGREKMIAGWRGYFDWFPDYRIEVNEILEGPTSTNGQTFAMFGFAGGSFKGDADAAWRIPAAWKAIVKDGRISLWQVFADTKTQFEVIERGSKK